MANPVKGEVALDLGDDGQFTLVMDMEALVEAESAYGKPLKALMADSVAGFVGASRALLFGALRTYHPKVTLRQASTLFQNHGEAVSEAMEKAATLAMPSEAGEPGKAARRAGANSGRNGAKQGSSRKRSGG